MARRQKEGLLKKEERMKIAFTISGVPKSLNVLLRTHWAELIKLKTRWLWKVLIGLDRAGYKRPYPCFEFAKITYIQHRHRLLDEDNLYGSVKIITDCLTSPIGRKKGGFSILRGDDPKHLKISVKQVAIKRASEEYTEIEIKELNKEE